ncbi:NADPH-dependent FMN reductase [Corynebacterium nasicanis]|uniref:NADPH-dependent FMN reductase n=1 Tax=Corynebacterium nasicanis TaxID=1448267 RepID=A0ABW1Q982_9CORY
MKIAVFLGSVRQGRYARTIGEWALEQLEARNDGHTYEIVDLLEQDIDPLTAEVLPGMAQGVYEDPKTTAWSQLIAGFDGYLFVTAEHNASVPAMMKNAYDQLHIEWKNKPVGYLAYGGGGGGGAVKHWRDITERVGMINLAADAQFAFGEFFPDYVFTPGERGADMLHAVADELVDALERTAVAVDA